MARVVVERGEHLRKGRIAHEILHLLKDRPLEIPSYKGISLSGAFLPKLERHGIGRMRRNSIRVAIDRLRRQRFVDYASVGDRGILRLSPIGEKRLRQYDLEMLDLEEPARWDRVWRLVMFDIPEEKKRARDAVSRKLKSLGFYQLQKSVFVHHKPCREEISFIQEFFDLGDFISYIEAKNLGHQEKTLSAFFKLK